MNVAEEEVVAVLVTSAVTTMGLEVLLVADLVVVVVLVVVADLVAVLVEVSVSVVDFKAKIKIPTQHC